MAFCFEVAVMSAIVETCIVMFFLLLHIHSKLRQGDKFTSTIYKGQLPDKGQFMISYVFFLHKKVQFLQGCIQFTRMCISQNVTIYIPVAFLT
jgi:hypothetical protein